MIWWNWNTIMSLGPFANCLHPIQISTGLQLSWCKVLTLVNHAVNIGRKIGEFQGLVQNWLVPAIIESFVQPWYSIQLLLVKNLFQTIRLGMFHRWKLSICHLTGFQGFVGSFLSYVFRVLYYKSSCTCWPQRNYCDFCLSITTNNFYKGIYFSDL